MEGRYNGGGGSEGNFSCQNLQATAKSLPFLRPRPASSAIDKFLRVSQNQFLANQELFLNNFSSDSHEFLNSFGSLSSGGGADYLMNASEEGGVSPLLPWPFVPPPSNFGFDGVVLGQNQNWVNSAEMMMMNPPLLSESDVVNKNSNANSKKDQVATPKALIKGQWTEEEDRELIKLVRKFGIKKWASIAGKIEGRAGKQCRERWHNHLRPNIKKETWNEEEERMLVEAHLQVGNRWAEIAKRIPGRTENSIKNHWNATKRKQYSIRKSRKGEGQNGKLPQSTILQDYIKRDCTKIYSASTAAATPAESSISDESAQAQQINLVYPKLSQSTSNHDSPSYDLTDQGHTDEINFMNNFFSSKINGSLVDSGTENPPDYISRRLEGGSRAPASTISGQNDPNLEILNDGERTAVGEMDLVEMVRQHGYIF